jgi:hypothetical protein
MIAEGAGGDTRPPGMTATRAASIRNRASAFEPIPRQAARGKRQKAFLMALVVRVTVVLTCQEGDLGSSCFLFNRRNSSIGAVIKANRR